MRLTIDIERIPEEEGGGWVASSPDFGRYAICGDGEAPLEALKDFVNALIGRPHYVQSLAQRVCKLGGIGDNHN